MKFVTVKILIVLFVIFFDGIHSLTVKRTKKTKVKAAKSKTTTLGVPPKALQFWRDRVATNPQAFEPLITKLKEQIDAAAKANSNFYFWTGFGLPENGGGPEFVKKWVSGKDPKGVVLEQLQETVATQMNINEPVWDKTPVDTAAIAKSSGYLGFAASKTGGDVFLMFGPYARCGCVFLDIEAAKILTTPNKVIKVMCFQETDKVAGKKGFEPIQIDPSIKTTATLTAANVGADGKISGLGCICPKQIPIPDYADPAKIDATYALHPGYYC